MELGKLTLWLCAGLTAGSLLGCASTMPGLSLPVTEPAASSQPEKSAAPAAAELKLAAPLPDIEESQPVDPRLGGVGLANHLSLDEVLQHTLNADPKLRSGFQSISQAEADVTTASTLPNPQLFTDIQLLPLGINITPQRQGGPPQSDVLISYPIDWFLFGKRAAAVVAARVGVQVSEAQYADQIRQRLRDASLAHYDLLETKLKYAAAQRMVISDRSIEDAARKAKKPATELKRIALHVLKREQELAVARANYLSAKARLRVFLGHLDTSGEFEIHGELVDPVERRELESRNLFELARQNRPDQTALELKVNQAQATVRAQHKQAYPQVSPQFGYSHQFQRDIGFPDADLWDAALTVSVPLFDRNQGGRAKAASALDQSMHDAQANLVALNAEIEQLVQDFLAAEVNAKGVEASDVTEATEVRDNLIKAYIDGKEQLSDMLDAQKDLFDTYDLFVTTRANYWRATVKLNAGVGQTVVP